MARIVFDAIAHSYLKTPPSEVSAPEVSAADGDWALRDIDQTWEDGGAYALLGPSGCGKTTLLNVISGLIAPTRGRILFDDRDVTGLTPRARNIAQVFQFPVIYDTMTVEENLAFPLRNRGLGRAETRTRVAEVAETLDLTVDLKRRARGLSVDAKQKISLGRGLVRDDVAAILFDEPLTVIDPHLKWLLRRKLKEIHERFHLTLIYVTHDQNEALTFADRVAVMNEGRILQVGSPRALFEAPRHTFVGYFIGSPGMNLIPCRIADGAAVVDDGIDGARIALDPALAARAAAATAPIELGIRPEFLRLADAPGEGAVAVAIAGVEDLGTYKLVTARLGPHRLKIKLGEDAPTPAERAHLIFPRERTIVYAGGRLVEGEAREGS